MHIGTKFRRCPARRWFKLISVMLGSITTFALILASMGVSDAAHTDRIFAPVVTALSQSNVARTPAGRVFDSLYRLVRANSGYPYATQPAKSSRVNSSAQSVVWFALLGTTPGTGGVNSYDAKGNLTVARTGLNQPFAVAVDRAENVYVANSGAHQVLIYKSGAITPSLTLDDSGYLPFSVAVNPRDGSVAVGNACHVDQTGSCNGAGNALIYKMGATKPSFVLNGIAEVISIAYDRNGDLWLDGETTSGGGTSIVGYYDSSPGLFHVFPIKPLVSPGTIAFDTAGNVAILDGAGGVSHDHQNSCSIVSIFKPGNIKPLRILTLGECLSDVVTSVAVDKASNILWALDQYLANLDNGLVYSYPAGQFEIRRSIVFPGDYQAYGVAVKP